MKLGKVIRCYLPKGQGADGLTHRTLGVRSKTLLLLSMSLFLELQGAASSAVSQDSVSVTADYGNLKSRSFPIQPHSGGLYLTQTTDLSITQSINRY